jgi:hypothetical protein
VLEAVEAADETSVVDALDPEVLQVVRAYDHVEVLVAVALALSDRMPATSARVPACGRDPQQGAGRQGLGTQGFRVAVPASAVTP